MRPVRFIVAMALPLTLTGCAAMLGAAAAVAGLSAVVWGSGWLREDIAQPLYRVHRAAGNAVLDHKVKVERSELEADSGRVEGVLPDGRQVIVKTSRLTDRSTRLRIRVGIWGDRAFSRRILEQLKKHL